LALGQVELAVKVICAPDVCGEGGAAEMVTALHGYAVDRKVCIVAPTDGTTKAAAKTTETTAAGIKLRNLGRRINVDSFAAAAVS
jgi:hypothetical protein